jgi:hypothetical protein
MSSQWPWYSPFISSLCQHIPHKDEILYAKFSLFHMRKGECSCSGQPGRTGGRTISSPLHCSMADGIDVGYSVSLIHKAPVTGIICHNLWLYGLLVTVAEITLCGGIVEICRHVYVAFVPPQYCCQVTPGSYVISAPFEFRFLWV